MKNLLSADIKGRTILLLFIATTVVYVVMLVITIPKLMTFSGGKEILDMIPTGYNADYVKDLMESLSGEGRTYYLTKQLPLDFIYPGLFAFTYALIFMFFLKKINTNSSPWQFVALLPIIAGFADYVENVCIISIIEMFPEVSTSLVQFSSVVSVLKAGATTIYFVALIVLLIIAGVRTVRNRRFSSLK
jgi:hypothetical protein